MKISKYPKIFELYHGKVPTIFLSLKDVVGGGYDTMISLFIFQVKKTLRDFVDYDFMGEFLPLLEKSDWSFEELTNTIGFLSENFSKHHNPPRPHPVI